MPVDRGVIDGQLREIGEGERWWELREFRDLPYVLNADERIRALVRGKLLGPRRPHFLRRSPWLAVATSQRLLFLRMERFGRQQLDLRLEEIVGMWQRNRLRAVQITFDAPPRRLRLRVAKEDAFRFVGAVGPLLPRPTRPERPGLAAGAVGLLGRATALPAAELATRAELARLEGTVDRLEAEVERLHQHVEFLESLLQSRSEGGWSLPRSPLDP